MGVDIITSGNFSSVSVGFSPPVSRGLTYYNNFGTSAARSARNLVVGSSSGSIIGTMTHNAGYVTLPGTLANYIETNVLETTAATLIAVFRQATSTTSIAVSTYSALTDAGISLYVTGPAPSISAARDNAGTYSAQLASVASIAGVTGWGFYVGRVDDSTQKMSDFTRGLATTATVTLPRRPVSGRTFRIGAGPSLAATATLDLAHVAIHNVVLTDAELQAIYLAKQAELAALSITI